MSNDSPAATAIVLTNRLHHHHHHHSSPPLILALTAEERTRSRHHFITEDGTPIYLQLARGTVLQGDDLLTSEHDDNILVKIVAKSEPVLTVTSDDSINLLRAAYHLGNRHVSLEITPTYLRLAPDPVLAGMLTQLGLQVVSELAPFCPQGGAYSHH
jgi:urease accessory protein